VPVDEQIASAIGLLVADLTGHAATSSWAFVDRDIVVCRLERGATKAERDLLAAGQAEIVRQRRDALVRDQLVAAVEQITGRTVQMAMSGILGEAWLDVFVLEPDPETRQLDTAD
jgi:uncharacterized protein YbcI